MQIERQTALRPVSKAMRHCKFLNFISPHARESGLAGNGVVAATFLAAVSVAVMAKAQNHAAEAKGARTTER